MKSIDVSKSVMEKVMHFEEQRSKRWITVFVLGIAIIAIVVGIAVFMTMRLLVERETFALFEIFSQDKEIIAEFWQDTILIFIAELPQQPLLLGTGMVLLLAAVWFITRRRRKIIARRLTELAKRRQKRV